MNILMLALRNWGWRNLQKRPVLSRIALGVVTVVFMLSFALWYYELTLPPRAF